MDAELESLNTTKMNNTTSHKAIDHACDHFGLCTVEVVVVMNDGHRWEWQLDNTKLNCKIIYVMERNSGHGLEYFVG